MGRPDLQPFIQWANGPKQDCRAYPTLASPKASPWNGKKRRAETVCWECKRERERERERLENVFGREENRRSQLPEKAEIIKIYLLTEMIKLENGLH